MERAGGAPELDKFLEGKITMNFRFHPTIRYAICVLIAFTAAAVALAVIDSSEILLWLISRTSDRSINGGVDFYSRFLQVIPAFLALAVSVIAWHCRKTYREK